MKRNIKDRIDRLLSLLILSDIGIDREDIEMI